LPEPKSQRATPSPKRPSRPANGQWVRSKRQGCRFDAAAKRRRPKGERQGWRESIPPSPPNGKGALKEAPFPYRRKRPLWAGPCEIRQTSSWRAIRVVSPFFPSISEIIPPAKGGVATGARRHFMGCLHSMQ
jgi:hypothetical protein